MFSKIIALAKRIVTLPYPGEHSARLKEPSEFAEEPVWKDGKPGKMQRTKGSGNGTVQGKKVPDTISVLWGKLKGKAGKDDPPVAQALRFPVADWTAEKAQAWLKDNEIKAVKFEAAASAQSRAGETYRCECLDCGHTMDSEQHCRDIRCPKCGGEMRRVERPGPGQRAPATQSRGADGTIRLATGPALMTEDLDLDRESGFMRNVSVITMGEAIGHDFEVDGALVDQIVALTNAHPKGAPIHACHPEITGRDPIWIRVGRITNLRRVGNQAKGDVQLGAYARSNPAGDLWNWLFDLAEDEEARQSVGLSPRFVPAPFEQRMGEAGNPLPPAGRARQVLSIDFAGEPGANPGGLLSRGEGEEIATLTEEGQMDEVLRKYLESIGLDPNASEEDAQKFLDGLEGEQKQVADRIRAGAGGEKPKGEGKTSPEPEPVGAGATEGEELARKAADQAIGLERKRTNEIIGLAQQCGLGREWADKHIQEGTTVQAAKEIALGVLAERHKPVNLGSGSLQAGSISVGADRDRETLAGGISDAILLRAGCALYEFDEVTGIAVRDEQGRLKKRTPHERAQQFRAQSILGMGRMFLSSLGVPDAMTLSKTRLWTVLINPRALAQAYGSQVVALAQSTSDFPYMLEDSMRKSLRAAYEESPLTWRVWARRATAPDFKDIKRVALSEAPDLVERKEGGGVDYGTMGESREVYALAEYVDGIKLSRRAVINDDMDAFSRIPRLQANAAGRKEDDVCYAILTANAALADGTALFHADHSNLAGSGAAPSSTTLNAARAAMRTQTGQKGANLNITPVFFIGPANLEGTILPIVVSEYDPSGSIANAQNIWRGKLTPVIEPRLDATVDADTDNKTWYLAANSDQVDTVEVCFLEDEQTPVLRQEVDFDTEDIKHVVRHTCAAKAIDHRGLYKDPGD